MKTQTEIEKLLKDNTKLAYSILWRKFPSLARDEDLQQEALIGLWKACLTFKEGQTQFSTYASTCIFNQIQLALRHRSKEIPHCIP